MRGLTCVLLLTFLSVAFAQLGGFSGPCSATAITGISHGAVSVFSTTDGAQSYSSGCTSSASTSGTTWFSITADAGNTVNVTTCNSYTNFDTILSLYNNSCSNLDCVVYNDDSSCQYLGTTSFLTFEANGDEYLIGVSGYNGQNGDFELIVTVDAAHQNPTCDSAIPLPGPYLVPLVLDGSNSNGGGYYESTCSVSQSSKISWYTISPASGLQTKLSTCNDGSNFDTIISVFSGQCGALECVVTNDDNCTLTSTLSTVTFTPTESEYYVAVSGYNGQSGTYQLLIAQEHSSCNGAQEIDLENSVTHTLALSTSGQPDLPHSICSSEFGPAVWVKFHAEEAGAFTASTCGSDTNFDTYMSVYSGNCDNLSCITYNDDYYCQYSSFDSFVSFDATAGEHFYVVVSGYGGSSGNVDITYTFSAY